LKVRRGFGHAGVGTGYAEAAPLVAVGAFFDARFAVVHNAFGEERRRELLVG